MSDLPLSNERTTGVAEANARSARPITAVVIAALLALAMALAVHLGADVAPLPYLLALAAAAFLGALVVIGWVAGFVHFGRLPRQRAFFDSLVNALDDACAVSDIRGRVIYANQAYHDLVATSSSGSSGRLIGVENLYAGYAEASEAIYRLSQAARDGKSAHEDIRLRAGSSAAGASAESPTWLRLSVSPLTSGIGQRFTLWRIGDVSRERAEQEKAFTNLQYIINYLDHAPAGFFSTTADGRIAYLNATLADWLGLDLPQSMEGSLKLADIVGASGQKLITGAKPAPDQDMVEEFDLDIPLAAGGVLPVHIIHRADFDSQGRPQPSRSLVLRRSPQGDDDAGQSAVAQLSGFINTAPIGIARLAADGVIIQANAMFIDLAGGKPRGATLVSLVDDATRPGLEQALEQARRAGPCEPIDVVFAGDRETTAQLHFASLGAGADGDQSLIVYAIDTTRHSNLEVQLAQSQKMQAVGQLAGGVAHDFNNVLTAIIGFSDLLLAKHRPTDPAFADIMNIKQNANRAANLVRQLLAFSRRQTLRPEVLSLSDVLADLGNLLGRLLGEKIDLEVVHGRDIWQVKIDVNQFEQVIINLAVNARDAMPEGGRLTVRTSNVDRQASRDIHPGLVPEGEYVLCEIADTGSGMPPEVVAKIYEPFFSTKEVGKGTGLGLSTVYGTIKQTGGFIFCDSEVGKGTTFRIYLPRHVEDTAAADGGEHAGKADAKPADLTGHGTILLVEDEEAVRSFASRALASRGYNVLEADSGERALEVVEQHKGAVDLILSDVVMPQMDGPTLLKELRQRGYAMKMVFISGYAEDAFEKNLEGQSDFAFLPKPFSLKQLAEAVKEALAA